MYQILYHNEGRKPVNQQRIIRQAQDKFSQIDTVFFTEKIRPAET